MIVVYIISFILHLKLFAKYYKVNLYNWHIQFQIGNISEYISYIRACITLLVKSGEITI